MRISVNGWYPCYFVTITIIILVMVCNIYNISGRTSRLSSPSTTTTTTPVEVETSEVQVDYRAVAEKLFNEPQPDVSIPVPMSEIMTGQPIVLAQDDQRVIEYVLSKGHLKPPSWESYNLAHANTNPSMGQGQYIQRILKNQTDGFFVECGALDGETRSNTLFLEKELSWQGLLVEGDPSNVELLRKKNRKAWVANTCLSIHPYPHTADFLQSFSIGKLLTEEESESGKDSTKVTSVQCVPLFTLLSALQVATVDYFSLDVEGSELQILKTIPFDKVFIRTLSVEFRHTKEGKDNLIAFMAGKGYRVHGEVINEYGYANDLMFVHQDVDVE